MVVLSSSTPVDNMAKLERLRKALTLARLDFDEVVQKCRDGACQFHDNEHACAITSVAVSGAFVTCYVIAVAGDIRGVPELAERIEQFARDNFCQAVEMDGRNGWAKVHQKLANDYFQIAIKYRKEL